MYSSDSPARRTVGFQTVVESTPAPAPALGVDEQQPVLTGPVEPDVLGERLQRVAGQRQYPAAGRRLELRCQVRHPPPGSDQLLVDRQLAPQEVDPVDRQSEQFGLAQPTADQRHEQRRVFRFRGFQQQLRFAGGEYHQLAGGISGNSIR